ncbi:hypothetical protein EUX98_g73 [Antrodiella citrinella]|uniref:Survival protein SurE-like phosphatase/nucleotidase domain-containing protein n=1 Tax=Antrodiella citrinella TaxID=2447956 RepID=A0A4S4N7V7_9APHY|nr:hypothetical protein EUX98_g73 [Antrodiella citrinella]
MKPDRDLQNDDGPPGHDSPYIYGLYKHLTQDLGWDVKVVIPSSQKSWIGKAYQITDVIHGRYFYPRGPSEYSTFVTPATCSNVALHNLYPGEIDLVISGPNLGRNTSAAFSLSSGTIGAALSSSLSRTRSIALSYGTVTHPVPTEFFDPANLLGSRIIRYLWDNWGSDDGGLRHGEVDLYNVNIPMVEGLLSEAGLDVYWTKVWRNSYGRLFKAHVDEGAKPATSPAGGPDAWDGSPTVVELREKEEGEGEKLVFKFAPDMNPLINPARSTLPPGSDAWAIMNGCASVTPLRASFAEPTGVAEPRETTEQVDKRLWKMKL